MTIKCLEMLHMHYAASIYFRGTLTEEEMCILLAYLSLLKADHVMRILRRAFLLVADKVFIEFSKYR